MNTPVKDKRITSKTSHTALMAAIYRFLANKELMPAFRGPDNMAYMFLPAKAKFFLSFSFFREYFKRKLDEKGPGSYAYVSARTRFFDELFTQAVRKHIPQIVFLGAGYDTRAIRFRKVLNGTEIFELDVPGTQNEKRKVLRKNRISIPENLHFVPINFETDNLKQVLFRAGYDPRKESLFIWEGVSMYLGDKAVDQTLTLIKANSGPGSTIAFDYLYKSVIRSECNYYGAKELSQIVKDAGEAFSFGIEEGQIEAFLAERGITLISQYTPSELEEEYLFDSEGRFFGRMYGFAGLVYAKLTLEVLPKNKI